MVKICIHFYLPARFRTVLRHFIFTPVSQPPEYAGDRFEQLKGLL